MNGDVKTGDVEGFEHDFGGILAVLRRVERRLRQQEVVVFRLGAQILENGLLPKSLHQVPIVDDAVTDGPLRVGEQKEMPPGMYATGNWAPTPSFPYQLEVYLDGVVGCFKSFIADEKIEI